MNYRLSLFVAIVLLGIAAQVVQNPASAQSKPISLLTIESDRPDYVGRCPMAVTLKGKLQAESPLGLVRYQFVHSDGTETPVSQLSIKSKGTFTVEETLSKNSGWSDKVFLRVYLPVPLDSNAITIKGQCQAAPSTLQPTTNSSAPESHPWRDDARIVRQTSFRPDNRSNINRYRLYDGDVIMMTVEEDPGIPADQIEIVLISDPNVTWWKSIMVQDHRDGIRTVNSISTQDDDHGPKAMRLGTDSQYEYIVFAKGKVLGVHAEMYLFGWDRRSDLVAFNGKRVIFTWQKD